MRKIRRVCLEINYFQIQDNLKNPPPHQAVAISNYYDKLIKVQIFRIDFYFFQVLAKIPFWQG